MSAGHTFGYLKIHPLSCNPYVAYFAKAFLHWTGGMKVRCRFGANFTNGGSFRIGFLPPHFNENQVSTGVPLSTLTAYPTVDMDPKNTDWTEFSTVDQRKVLYHSMDTEGEDSFGGWIVFFVAMPLVSTMQASGNVSLIVETAGDFQFRQPAPLGTDITPVRGSPLTHSLTRLKNQIGVDSAFMGTRNGLQICASSTTSVKAGFYRQIGLGNRTPTSFPGCTFTKPAIAYRDAISNTRFGMPASAKLTHDQTSNEYAQLDGIHNFSGNVPNGIIVYQPHPTQGIMLEAQSSFNEHNDVVQIHVADTLFRDNDIWMRVPESTSPVPISLASNMNSVITPLATGESIVLWVDFEYRMYNTQTEAQRDDLKNTVASDTLSYIYALKSRNTQGVLLLLRLNPNGMWTSPATTVDTILPFSNNDEFFLEFIEILPVSTPLPKQNSARKFYSSLRANQRDCNKSLVTLFNMSLQD